MKRVCDSEMYLSMFSLPQDKDSPDIPGWGRKDQEDWWGRGFLNWSPRQSRGWEDETKGRSLPRVWRGGQDCTGPRGPSQGKFTKEPQESVCTSVVGQNLLKCMSERGFIQFDWLHWPRPRSVDVRTRSSAGPTTTVKELLKWPQGKP